MPFKLPNYSDLNPTQKAVLSRLGHRNKMAVIGGPGTGKTIIGIEAAIYMASSHQNCLFLTYSTVLSDFIKGIIRTEFPDSIIDITTFNKFLFKEIQSIVKLNADDIFDKYQIKKYKWDEKKLRNLFSVSLDPRNKKYNYIFVDEAQDLDDISISFLTYFTDNIVITFDDSQKIISTDKKAIEEYDHSNIMNALQIDNNFFDLIENYRNTVEIEKVGKIFLDSYDTNNVTLPKVTSTRKGTKPNIILADLDNFEVLAENIVKDYDKSKTVGIIFGGIGPGINVGEKFQQFNDILKRLCKEQDITYNYKYGTLHNVDFSKNGIFLLSDVSSKGLEFDEVYVYTKYMNADNYINKNKMYVSFTRSKDISNILIDDLDRVNSLYAIIKNYEFLFNKIDWRIN